jgi:4-hydroxythreonine-4-phosphate dehydrogenase
MVQGNLRVGLTDHIPVSEVASRLTEDLIIEKLKQ